MTITVMLVDDHDLIRRSMRDLLDPEPDLEVIGDHDSAESARADLDERGRGPDVALIDVELPGEDGISLCRHLTSHYPDTVCLILSSHADDQTLMDAITAGACGHLSTTASAPELVTSVRTAAAGGSLLDPTVTARILGMVRDDDDGRQNRLRQLSAQERTLLELLAEGLTNRQIAERMFLSEKTVKNYVSNLLRKLGMKRRTEAAGFASTTLDAHRSSPAA